MASLLGVESMISIGVILDNLRSASDLAIDGMLSSSDIAHHALFAWTYSSTEVWNAYLSMESFDLELTELDIEVGYKVLEDVTAFSHQFGGLLVGQNLFDVLVWALEVREEQNEDFLRIS